MSKAWAPYLETLVRKRPLPRFLCNLVLHLGIHTHYSVSYIVRLNIKGIQIPASQRLNYMVLTA